MRSAGVRLLLASAATAYVAASSDPGAVAAAFERDGFVVTNKAFTADAWGIVAENPNVTLFTTGSAKRAFFVSGDAYGSGCVEA